MDNYIGIDISKSSMSVYIPKIDKDIKIKNSKEGLKTLFSKLKKQYKKEFKEIVFVYEATGSYSTLFENYCQEKEMKCFKVDAAQSSSFSITIKNRSKTDRVDAKMLSQMQVIAKQSDIKVPSRDEDAHKIRSFIKYYDSLTKEKTRLTNYLEASTYNDEDRFIIQRVKRRVNQIVKEREEIILKVVEIIKSNNNYYKAYKNIISITGIGPKSAAILLYLFLRYPNASRNQIIALCGLDAIERQSGTSLRKKPKISKKGITLVRGNLFMPSLCSIQKNRELKEFYEKLVNRGKPKPLAVIAVMRKLILLAHSLYKSGQQYDPERYLQYSQKQKEKVMV